MARSARLSNLRLTFPKLISLRQVNPPSKSLISPLNDKYPNNGKRFEVSALRGSMVGADHFDSRYRLRREAGTAVVYHFYKTSH